MREEYYYRIFDMEDKRWWSVARRSIIEKVLKCLKLNNGIDIMELGCGSGGNLELLSRFGNVFAMDSDSLALKLAKTRKVGIIKKGTLPDDIPFGSKQFEIITLLDVLEHIDNELSALLRIKKRLKQNGRVIITVPAYNFLWSRIDIDSGHKRRYVKHTLNRLIRKAGYVIEYSTYLNTFLFPIIVMIRIINSMRGKQDHLDLKEHSRLLNSLLTKIFSLEKKIIPTFNMPFGVSILTIARKP